MLTLNNDNKYKINMRELWAYVSNVAIYPNWLSDMREKYYLVEGKQYIVQQDGARKQTYITVDSALVIAQNSRKRNEDVIIFLSNLIEDSDRIEYVIIRKEHQFFELLNTTIIEDWETQYNIDNTYYLDFYSNEYNLIIEYDEKYHVTQTQEDAERMKYCIEWFDNTPTVIRVAEDQELQGLKEINKFIMGRVNNG